MLLSPPAQIGEFYETIGFDALLLCQFAKINPMAPHRGVSRAGVPLGNMPRAIRALNTANLSVVRGSVGSRPEAWNAHGCGTSGSPNAASRAWRETFWPGARKQWLNRLVGHSVC